MRTALAASLGVAFALLAGGCGTGGIATKGDVNHGRGLFTQKCAACHTLADAGSQANIGPNLDDAFAADRAQKFSESSITNVVLDQIRLSLPPMPANLFTGQDAEDVSAYVASVAGKSPGSSSGTAASGGGASTGATTTAAAGGGGATASGGKAIFTQNCASCHTLKDAAAKGKIGPNLDQLKPGLARVKHQVINGAGVMPAFKGRLSDDQIDQVSQYVARVAGK